MSIALPHSWTDPTWSNIHIHVIQLFDRNTTMFDQNYLYIYIYVHNYILLLLLLQYLYHYYCYYYFCNLLYYYYHIISAEHSLTTGLSHEFPPPQVDLPLENSVPGRCGRSSHQQVPQLGIADMDLEYDGIPWDMTGIYHGLNRTMS